MSDKKSSIQAFESAYNYDATYMHRLLAASPEAYAVFEAFLPMGHFRRELCTEAFHVAKIVVMKIEDCGSCLQLSVKMALEAGLSPATVRAALGEGVDLSASLQLVHRFAAAVAGNAGVEEADIEALVACYGDGGLAELALAIASARVYPSVKRAMGLSQSCSLQAIEV